MSDRALGLAALGVVGIVGAIVLIAASGPESDYTTLCQNADYIRIDDTSCDRGDRGSTVMYISTGSDYHAPAVGGRIEQARVVNVIPSGKTVQKSAIAKEGGVVKSSPHIIRGGLGSAFKGSSGG